MLFTSNDSAPILNEHLSKQIYAKPFPPKVTSVQPKRKIAEVNLRQEPRFSRGIELACLAFGSKVVLAYLREP
ncbi:hypothetical protein NPIL_337941 [Nephila pilipes]|uniref:Uncharacterized protein n=1 Tax=Nephila pilipes TaxID=299642 RepID=A0A8X6Q1T6_NEPPI|nr:hypothetical protein NPIL_337941 [Nephila pilipes]